ncbi:MAG: hypothetical protein QF662_07125, partial [Phycisphaerae bacterium]|nr:hypothetical protein [Phycisphaerae bacterium]
MKRTGRAGAVLWAAAGLLLALSAGGCGRPLTFVLVEYAGPEAMSSAQRVAGELREQGLKEVFIIGDKTFASVCSGKFTERKDPRAKRLLKQVRQIRDGRGHRPFALVIGLVPVPEPPIANPWPLEKADGVYTVQVASFGLPGRQNAATAHATKLRKEGWHVYIHHGPTLSTVTIGAFNRDIFDDPRLVLRPDVTRQPRIISPAVNSIMDAFPV